MKITIASPIARVGVDMPEEQVMILLRMAIDLAGGKEKKPALNAPFTNVDSERKSVCQANKRVEHIAPPETIAGYKGFLFIKCDSCGKEKGFNVKTPIGEHRCECGCTTPLRELKPMHFRCKCGADFRYRTNMTGDVISMNCFICGAPVDLEYHNVKQEYETML